MVIARVFEAKGWTPNQYDELIAALVAEMGLRPGQAAPGVLFHWVTQTENGMRAIDVYDSRDAADKLVQQHIGPIAGQLDLPLPEITEHEVRNWLTEHPAS